MPELNFNVPFSGFSSLDFFNCLAAVYTYLEHEHNPAEYKFGWDYDASPRGMQEDWYFILGTMSGQNSLIEDFDGKIPSADREKAYGDFCMKFCGYNYRTADENFADEISASIEKGFPVIAVVKNCEINRNCRVITGFKENEIITPDESGAQGKYEPLSYGDLSKLYIITEKTKPEYTLIDGLKNIERSLVSVLEGGMWDDLYSRFKFWDGLRGKPFEETKAVFERAMRLMWNFDHCHNFAETFRHKALSELQDERFAEACVKIDKAYDSSHNVQWAVQGLYDCRDWKKREWQSKEAGMCMFAQWGIEKLKQNDIEVLEAVREMISAFK